MSEEKLPEEHKGEDRGYTPASPLKRTMAWIALAYVLILLALTTYYFYTGTTLGNLAPLLTVPGHANGSPSCWLFCAGWLPWPLCPSALWACCQTSAGSASLRQFSDP